MAAKANQEAQRKYKHQYDKLSTLPNPKYQISDWVFPSDVTGKMHKMPQPWHDPYRIISRDDPDVTECIFRMTSFTNSLNEGKQLSCVFSLWILLLREQTI